MATYTGIQDIPLVAGHPALDLVNTVEPRLPGGAATAFDHFAEASALLVWAGRSGLLGEQEIVAEEQVWQSSPELAERCRGAVVVAREALYDVLLAGIDGGSGDRAGAPAVDSQLELLSANRAAAVARTRLQPVGGSAVGFAEIVGTEPGLVLLDRIAVAAVDLLTTGELGRLRACPIEEGGCGWLFLDRSRGRTRRWCVMADCGTKAKARRLNDRRRIARQRS